MGALMGEPHWFEGGLFYRAHYGMTAHGLGWRSHDLQRWTEVFDD